MLQRDQILLLALKFVRMLAFGQTTIVLVPFLLAVGSSDEKTGWFMTLTLLGDVALSVVVTGIADRIGRRTMLLVSSLSMLLSGVIFSVYESFWVLLPAAIFGVISPSGDEVGPFRAIEESTLAHLTLKKDLPIVFAYQNILGTAGMAIGFLSGGWIVHYLESFKKDTHRSSDLGVYQSIFAIYAALGLVAFLIAFGLTTKIEDKRLHVTLRDAEDLVDSVERDNETSRLLETELPEDQEPELQGTLPAMSEGETENVWAEQAELSSPRLHSSTAPSSARGQMSTRALTLSLLFLFGIDSLAYGFMPNSWVVEYMERTFNSSASDVGNFLFLADLISAFTSIPAVFLTRALGPVAAISSTKIGAGLFAAVVPLAMTSKGAMIDLLLRSLFDTMDVVPRQVFLTTVVSSEERTRILGLVNVIKTLARSVGPVFTGILASNALLYLGFYIMGGLELVFALVIYCVFT